jgi:hypothetical protein
MQRELVVEHPFYEVEQCPAENVQVYRVHGLRLYDAKDERNNGPVIDLVRSMPGVAQACFRDRYTLVVRRSLRMAWQDVGSQIVNLIHGVLACSDGCRPRKEVNSEFSTEHCEAFAATIVRSAKRRPF